MWIPLFHVVYFILLHSYLCELADKGHILALQIPGSSRWTVLKALAHELREFGYKTTIVRPAELEIETPVTDSAIDVIDSEGLTQVYHIFEIYQTSLMKNAFSGVKGFVPSTQFFNKFCEYLLNDSGIMETLRKRKFVAAVIDTPFLNPCFSVIPYKLSIPFIHFGRSIEHQKMRTWINPGVYPSTWYHALSDQMSYLERVYNTIYYMKLMTFPDALNPRDLVGKYAPEMPHLTNQQLQAKTELYLLETDELMDYHLATSPDMKLIGGAVTRPAEPLSGDLKSIMDSAIQGAVIVSFGSVVKEIPENVLNKLEETFKEEEKLKFVFRSGIGTKIVGNVMYLPWIPQNDLLGHINTKIFITHCGEKGQFEALYHGVPMIGMPVFADQHYNALRMVRKGFGIKLDVVDFTPEGLRSAIQEILRDSSYKERIQKASEIFRNRPMPPGKRAAWWIDHVIKYGGDHLHSEAIHLPLYQFLLVDVFCAIGSIIVLFVFICCMCFKTLRYAKHRMKQKTD